MQMSKLTEINDKGKGGDKMHTEGIMDTHVCLCCHTKIIGLDDYIVHKRKECPALNNINLNEKTEENIEKLSNDESNEPNICQKTVKNTALIESCDEVSSNHSGFLQDAFLTMLKLKSKNSLDKEPATESERSDKNGNFESLEPTCDHNYDSNKSDKMEDDEKEREIDKRKYCQVCDKYLENKFKYNKHFNSYLHLKRVNAGLLTDKSEQNSYNCAVCKKNLSSKIAYLNHMNCSLHLRKVKMSELEETKSMIDSNTRKSLRQICKKKLINNNNNDEEESENDVSEITCDICKKKFENKQKAFHLLLHFKQAESVNGKLELIYKHLKLFTKFSSFQCGICSYYFNNFEYFLDHFQSDIHNENMVSMIGPFWCVECDQVCNSNLELLEHLKSDEHSNLISTPKKMYQIIIKEKKSDLFCQVCDLQIATALLFKNHFNSASHKKLENKNKKKKNNLTKINFFNCKSCSEEFSDSAALQEHQLTHVKEEKKEEETRTKSMKCIRICPLCNEVVTNGILGEVTEHVCPELKDEMDTESVKYSCSKCNYSCSSSSQFVYHRTLHENPEVTLLNDVETERVVDVVENVMENDELAETEIVKKKKGKRIVRKFKCTFCNKFYLKTALLSHLNTHTGEKPYKCNLCELSFAQKANLYMHVKRHAGVKEYKCDQCPFTTEKPSRLKRHKETHIIDRPRPHLCDVCGAGYHDKWKLKHHMKVHNGKNLKCPVKDCPHAFRCPSELTLHMRVHNNERPFLCDTCGYRGRSQHQLTKHRRSHTGERPFKCPHCSYSAHLSTHLMRHMRIHTGAKPYKCPYCDYTCNTQENVRKHILKTKKHEGKKMYPCPFCDYSTNTAVEYKSHVLENHKDNDKYTDAALLNNRNKNDATSIEPIPYIPRHERVKNNNGQAKIRRRVVKEKNPVAESIVYTFRLPEGGKHILQAIEENNGEQIYFDGEETEICTQVEENIDVPPMEVETVVTSDLSSSVIHSQGQNLIYIYLQD